MKPNPVKKTVEYCRLFLHLKCEYHRREDCHHWCMKHKKTIEETENYDCVRPSWCTDEIFLRVKIEPVVEEGEEYCQLNGRKCNLLHSFRQGLDLLYLCGVIDQTFFPLACKKRPDACRKLEVE